MENITSHKNIPDVIYLKNDEIFTDGNTAYGVVYFKTTTKKFWTKWSRRCFFLTNKSISFWKQKKCKRKKFKRIFFTSYFNLGGLENVLEYDNNYLTFDIFYNYRNCKKKYTFKSYNIDLFSYIYQMIDRCTHDKYRD